MADEADPARTAKLSGVALIATFVALLAFGAFVVYLINETSATELKWTRLAWVFSSVEAIAFGAAGALFGSSIQRDRAEKAEAKAEERSDAAAKGEALASVLKADGDGGGTPALESLGPDARAAVTSVAARHAALARELFP